MPGLRARGGERVSAFIEEGLPLPLPSPMPRPPSQEAPALPLPPGVTVGSAGRYHFDV